MTDKTKIINIRRRITLEFSGSVPWPEAYPGVSLAEAVESERSPSEDTIDLLLNETEPDSVSCVTMIEVSDDG